MKLRLSGTTVRLRLTEDDVAAFRSTSKVEAVLRVGGSVPSSWRYALVASADVAVPSVKLDGGGLSVVVPVAEAMAWAESGEVGLYAEADGLEVKVEKDLGCDHEAGPTRGR